MHNTQYFIINYYFNCDLIKKHIIFIDIFYKINLFFYNTLAAIILLLLFSCWSISVFLCIKHYAFSITIEHIFISF